MFDDINTVVVSGRLTKDVDLKSVGSDNYVGKFSIASDRSFKKDGEWSKKASFFNVTVWGKLAELASKFSKKGDPVTVVGRLEQQVWEKDGQKRSNVEIVASDIRFPSKKKESAESGVSGNSGEEVLF